MKNDKYMAKFLIFELKKLAFPSKGFANYQNGGYYFYTNFLEYMYSSLYDNYSLDIRIEDGTFKKWGATEQTIAQLKKFALLLDEFDARHDEISYDFTLLRDKYWHAFSAEAKKCVQLLERDIKEVK